ncbi:MAG: S1 RNA-binding domain-containing protein, partial [Candidatus Saccharicenans sp.]
MLAKLSDDPAWKNEVWAFWARTHHLRVDRQGLLPGTTTDPVDIRAAVTVIHLTPEEQHRKVLAEFATKHPPFSVVDCMVTALRKDGAVVDLGGGLSGFIPLAELSWANPDRGVWHSEQVIDTGESVRVLVMEIPDPPADPQLSIRRLTPDPWLAFMHSHPVGARVSARVKRVLPTIAFVDLGNDVEGIVRISEASHDFLDAIGDALIEEESINAAVMSFDDARRQVELSIKELLPPPYDEYKGSHRGGETVLATVSRIGPAHLYVRLSGGASGAIHIGQVSYDKVEDLARLFTVGQEISAQILKYNDERNQVELSLKALLPNPYNSYRRKHQVGESVYAAVINTIPAMAFVDLGGGVQGTIHVSQLAAAYVSHPDQVVTKGQRVSPVIIAFDDAKERVQLSLKAAATPPSPPYTPPKSPVRRTVVAEGANVDEAIAIACSELGVSRYNATIDIIDQG